jgi:2-octaprenyl-6-methoxyphenol hydroxylase
MRGLPPRGQDYLDVAVIGAGPVGATLAALCHGAGITMALFEAREGPARDARTLALSHASRVLLEEARAWPAQVATPITSIHISQKGGPGRTLIRADEQGLPALGYTVGFAQLQQALDERVADAGIPVHYAHACDEITLEPEAAVVRFTSGASVRAKLLVLADGGANARRIPGIAFNEKDYAQAAVVAAVHSDRPHDSRAYERFTPGGPVALLPVGERYALVWTAAPAEAQRLLALDDSAFLAELQAHFGDRAGRFTAVSNRASFPLVLRAVNAPVALRTVIVGNAAQALHPIAGQGLNLGLRDAAALSGLLLSATPEAVGERAMLDAYRSARRQDAARGILFTDLLVSAFADSRRIPTWGRGLGLAVLDLFPPARRLLAERMIRGASA